MDGKELIPVSDVENIEEGSVRVVRRKKRRRKGNGRKLLAFVLVTVCIAYACMNFNELSAFALSIKEKLNTLEDKNPPDFSSGGDSSFNQNENKDESSSENENEDVNEEAFVPENAYKILESFEAFVDVNNEAGVNLDFEAVDLVKANDIYAEYGNEAPCVLIIHRNCLEGYSNGVYYSPSDGFYGYNDNVSDVGKVICNSLNDGGIKSIHIDTVFANGSIFSSKKEYEKALDEALKKYPSISYVIEISRDVSVNKDMTMNKNVFNEDYAQIKLTVGSSEDESNNFWNKNLSFAKALAEQSENLICGITLSSFELSQNIEPVCIRVDVGSYGNTIDEAILSGKELALIMCGVLNQG